MNGEPQTARALRLVRMIQFVLIFSVLIYVVVGESIGPKEARDVRMIYIAFGVLTLIQTGFIFLMRSTLIEKATAALRLDAGDSLTLGRWQALMVVTLAMSESVALYGLVVRVLGASLKEASIFYGAGILLLFLCSPRKLD
jgi:hypothetical protein